MTTPCWIAYLRQSYASNIRSSATFPTISHDTSVQNNFDYHIGREIFMLFGSFVFSKKYTNSSCISFFVVDRSAMAVVVAVVASQSPGVIASSIIMWSVCRQRYAHPPRGTWRQRARAPCTLAAPPGESFATPQNTLSMDRFSHFDALCYA